tara:strand:- start:1593 stop:1850 length:258 start_codon:yes stop_codon:yes gene_type:complete
MTETIRPDCHNVSIGDTLIISNRLKRLPITSIDFESIVASDEYGSVMRFYEDAVVMKKNGMYLFGEKAEAMISDEKGFGGLRLLV